MKWNESPCIALFVVRGSIEKLGSIKSCFLFLSDLSKSNKVTSTVLEHVYVGWDVGFN